MHRRNVAVIVVFCLVIAGPFALMACEAAGIQLPSWLTAEDATWYSGGIETADLAGSTSLEGFLDGRFQEAVETEVENHVPAKATAMLANAGWQRGFIAASDAVFGWGAYPTFYGSNRAYLPAEDAVITVPETYWNYDGWRAFGQGLAAFAQAEPDRRFVVYVVSDYSDAGTNPVVDLLGVPDWGEEAEGAFRESLDGVPNVTILRQDYAAPEGYFADYYRSDNHWNATGALKAANRISQALDLGTIESGGTVPIGSYIGSGSRVGLIPVVDDDVRDEAVDYSGITVDHGEGDVVALDDHAAYEALPDAERAFRLYEDYFGDLLPKVFRGGSGSGTGLLVCDSYGQCLSRPLSTRFRELVFDPSLYYWNVDDVRLADLIGESGAGDVVFVAYLIDYEGFVEHHPNFFATD